MAPMKVVVKWKGRNYCDVDVAAEDTVFDMKKKIQTSTEVEPKNQKVFFKGKLLKDGDTVSSCKLEDGASLMLMGTPSKFIPALDEAAMNISDVTLDGTADSANKVPRIQQQGYTPCGLKNFGNHCYFNASLQALLAQPEIREYLINLPENQSSSSLIQCLGAIAKTINRGEDPSLLVYGALGRLVAEFPAFQERVMGQEGILAQQDAEECFSSLLNTIADNDAKVGDLFSGMMSVTMSNESTSESETKSEAFSKLSCHIGRSTLDIYDGINDTLAEVISKHSDVANATVDFQKTSKISQFPALLSVNFVRFFWKPKEQVKAKILKKVKFPINIDLKRFASTADGKGNASGCEYELSAVITHVGRSADSGHYIAWVRDSASKGNLWWKCDDSKILAVSEDDIKKLDGGGDWPMAYVCLYRLKKPEA